jgi:hypothetical protein
MKTFSQFINEATQNDVYVAGNDLWIAYAAGSGTVIPNIKNKSFVTDKQYDKNFDSATRNIVNWSKTALPMKAKSNSKLYKIPMFDTNGSTFSNDKPIGYMYMNVDSNPNVSVVNFFKTKNEAMSWINHIA